MPHADPDVRRAYIQAWKRRNRGRYAEQDATWGRMRHANRRAALYGTGGILTQDDVKAVMAAGKCFYCGGTHLLGLDHRIPLHAGGFNTRENLVCACRSCNSLKSRGAAPGRWANERDCCVSCGTSERPHLARGRCSRCYRRERKANRAKAA